MSRSIVEKKNIGSQGNVKLENEVRNEKENFWYLRLLEGIRGCKACGLPHASR